MIARILAVIAVVAVSGTVDVQSQPPKRNRPNVQSGESNQPPGQPPINVTVATPEPRPEESAREAAYRQREISAQEDVRDFTRWLTYLTSIQALIGLVGFGVSLMATNAATNAAKAAIAANAISHDAMIADQRPWVALNVSIAGPLAYDDAGWDAGPRWHVPIRYQLSQLGNTPATHVAFFAQIYPLYLPLRTENKKLFDDVCGFAEGLDEMEMGFGEVMFPTEPRDRTFHLNGNPQIFEEMKTSVGYTGQFRIVACVTYGSTISKDRYRTAKAFHLWRTDSDINPSGETIPSEILRLTVSPMNGSYAK